jgi:hypothetical protein
MEASAVLAHEYYQEYKRQKIEEHKLQHSHEKRCSGLTNKEWFKTPTRQKSTFSKTKKYAYTRLWNHKHVPTEERFNSLTIKVK